MSLGGQKTDLPCTVFNSAAPQLGLAQTVTILVEAKVINSIANVFASV